MQANFSATPTETIEAQVMIAKLADRYSVPASALRILYSLGRVDGTNALADKVATNWALGLAVSHD